MNTTTSAAGKPVLLTDVDGVLNPFVRTGDPPAGWEAYRLEVSNPLRGMRTYTVWLARAWRLAQRARGRLRAHVGDDLGGPGQ